MGDSNDVSDVELLDAWANGGAAAGDALCRRYIEPLYRFFRNKVSTGAEDLVQRTLTGAVEARSRYEGRASFRAFLYGIARNVLLEDIRRRRRHPVDPDFSSQSFEQLDPSPSSAVATREQHERLRIALRRLPADFQVALELYYWEALTAVEVAAVVGLSEAGVRSRLRRAKLMLHSELEALGATTVQVESSIPARDPDE